MNDNKTMPERFNKLSINKPKTLNSGYQVQKALLIIVYSKFRANCVVMASNAAHQLFPGLGYDPLCALVCYSPALWI